MKKLKRILAALLVCITIFGMIPSAFAEQSGVDVVNHAPSWYKAKSESNPKWFLTESNYCQFMADVKAWRDDKDTPSSAKGTVKTISSPNYMVYLPPNYQTNENKEPLAYDLVITVARLNDTAADTVTRTIGTIGGVNYGVQYRDVYDYMISNGLCRPFILAAISDGNAANVKSNFANVAKDVTEHYKTYQHYYNEHKGESDIGCAKDYRSHQMISASSKGSIIMSNWGSANSSGTRDSANYALNGWPESDDFAYYSRYVATAPGATYATSDLWRQRTKSATPEKAWTWGMHSDNYFQMLQMLSVSIMDVHHDSGECECHIGNLISFKTASANTNTTNGNTAYSLKGAKFGLYSKAACTEASLLETMVSDANGKVATAKRYEAGTYYIKEIAASSGYELDSAVHKVVLSANGTLSGDVTFKKTPIVGQIKITMKSSSPDVTDGNSYYKYNATYGVYADAECEDLVKSVKLAAGTNKGSATVGGLPIGRTYYVKEIINSQNFTLSEAVSGGIKLTSKAPAKSVTMKVNPVTVKLNITMESSNTSVTNKNDAYKYNAVYGVYSDSDCANLVQSVTLSDSGVGAIANLPIMAKYFVKEKEAPTGFALSSTVKSQVFTYAFHTIRSADLTVGTLSYAGKNTSNSKRLRTGFIYLDAGTYYLKRNNANLQSMRYEYDENKSLVVKQSAWHGADGIDYFTLAKPGYVRFIFRKSDNSVIATSDFAQAEGIRSFQSNMEMTNAPKTGKITITKKSSNPDVSDGNSAYKYNAVYGVYADNECTQLVKKVTLTNGTNKGKATVSGLPLGIYFVKEISTSSGFALNSKASAGIRITNTDLARSVTMLGTPNAK